MMPLMLMHAENHARPPSHSSCGAAVRAEQPLQIIDKNFLLFWVLMSFNEFQWVLSNDGNHDDHNDHNDYDDYDNYDDYDTPCISP